MSLSATDLQTLSSKAIAAKETAYCPYSRFRVGACLLTISGEFIAGINIENVSYPVGVCAERCAMGTAVAAGHRTFRAIAVATDINPPASPCGMCRQFMRQFCDKDFPVYMYGADGSCVLKTMGELLPDSFSPADLEAGQAANPEKKDGESV